MKNYTLILLLILLVSCKDKIEDQIIECPPLTDEDVAYWIPYHLNDTLTFINDSNPDIMRLIIKSYENWASEGRCGGCEAAREMSTTIDPEYQIALSFMVYETSDEILYIYRLGKFEDGTLVFNSNEATIKESFFVNDSLDQTSGFIEPTEVNNTVYENSIHLIPGDWISRIYVVPYLGLMKFEDSQTGIIWERVI